MADRQSPTDDRSRSEDLTEGALLRTALDQFREECRLYNEAVGNYNTHLDNHRDRRDLHDLPFRDPVTAHDAFDDAADGDCSAMETLLDHLLDQVHLDSQLRRHPRAYPIHAEATEHLEIAREQLVGTLEEAIHHANHEE